MSKEQDKQALLLQVASRKKQAAEDDEWKRKLASLPRPAVLFSKLAKKSKLHKKKDLMKLVKKLQRRRQIKNYRNFLLKWQEWEKEEGKKLSDIEKELKKYFSNLKKPGATSLK